MGLLLQIICKSTGTELIEVNNLIFTVKMIQCHLLTILFSYRTEMNLKYFLEPHSLTLFRKKKMNLDYYSTDKF
jgi:hypothetical protein